ncbi:MAG TPA: MBL fold metallo-hydrolase [Candidatus Dormibacteraeota bacterium]
MAHPQAEHATSFSPFRTAWFEVAKMEAGVYLVSEPGHVNSWLIEGSKSAVLFDTGLGVANIRKVAEEITPHKLLVVNSHYHFDHTGDLGGRKLQVLHTPGHSPDCICLFDEANGLLFGGDTINTGPIYAQLEDSDLEKFARSTARLAQMADGYRRVFPAGEPTKL